MGKVFRDCDLNRKNPLPAASYELVTCHESLPDASYELVTCHNESWNALCFTSSPCDKTLKLLMHHPSLGFINVITLGSSLTLPFSSLKVLKCHN